MLDLSTVSAFADPNVLGRMLLEDDGTPMLYISQSTAEYKASVMSQQVGVRAKVRAYYKRGEMLGYVIRVSVDVQQQMENAQ